MSNASMPAGRASPSPSRRDFLYLATGAFAAAGTVAVVWPLISQMSPDAQTIAAGAPFDVDISAIAPGQQISVLWRGHPVFIVNRTPAALATLQDSALIGNLRDPDSSVLQQPPYARNWHRSIDPQWFIVVGVCTHLGCIPLFEPNRDQQGAGWPGGYFCPCHGSKYDLAGRVYKSVPAPYNLPVPPYRMVDARTLRLGENPSGETFSFEDVVQL
jgi:ubiquinol-cytochrome c reductase iron-sulfur subunit